MMKTIFLLLILALVAPVVVGKQLRGLSVSLSADEYWYLSRCHWSAHSHNLSSLLLQPPNIKDPRAPLQRQAKETMPRFLEMVSPYQVPTVERRRMQLSPEIVESMMQDTPTNLPWEPEACAKMAEMHIPRVFLKRVLTGIAERAQSRRLKAVTAEFIDQVYWMN